HRNAINVRPVIRLIRWITNWSLNQDVHSTAAPRWMLDASSGPSWRSIEVMNRLVFAFAVPLLVSAAPSAAPQELTRCVAGQQVIDKEGRSGVVVADDSKLCQVKYSDGQIYNWIFWNLRSMAATAEPGLVT